MPWLGSRAGDRAHELRADASWPMPSTPSIATIMLATEPGPVQLFPVLRVQPQATVAQFDSLHPDGADCVIPDLSAASWPPARRLPDIGERAPARALDGALDGIERRYGNRTAGIVATQLEYPRQAPPR